MSENSYAMPTEPLSPELALVDPELGARARAALPETRPCARRGRDPRLAAPPVPAGAPTASAETRPYPIWARMTAALWLLVLGMLIGGTAIPHAQDRPRVVPAGEDVTICPRPTERSTPDQLPPGQPARPVAVRPPRLATIRPARGYSSVGRAPGSHPGGRRFEPASSIANAFAPHHAQHSVMLIERGLRERGSNFWPRRRRVQSSQRPNSDQSAPQRPRPRERRARHSACGKSSRDLSDRLVLVDGHGRVPRRTDLRTHKPSQGKEDQPSGAPRY